MNVELPSFNCSRNSGSVGFPLDDGILIGVDEKALFCAKRIVRDLVDRLAAFLNKLNAIKVVARTIVVADYGTLCRSSRTLIVTV